MTAPPLQQMSTVGSSGVAAALCFPFARQPSSLPLFLSFAVFQILQPPPCLLPNLCLWCFSSSPFRNYLPFYHSLSVALFLFSPVSLPRSFFFSLPLFFCSSESLFLKPSSLVSFPSRCFFFQMFGRRSLLTKTQLSHSSL